MAVVYKKTELGSVAVTEREILPDPKLRTLLILVDGKKTHEDLLRMGAALGDVENRIATLLGQGWIEAVQTAAAVPPKPAVAPPAVAAQQPVRPAAAVAPVAAPAAAGAVNLEELKRTAVRKLTDLIGPTAEYYAVKIESAKNDVQLRQFVQQAAESVMASHGRAKALDYYNSIVSRLPPA